MDDLVSLDPEDSPSIPPAGRGRRSPPDLAGSAIQLLPSYSDIALNVTFRCLARFVCDVLEPCLSFTEDTAKISAQHDLYKFLKVCSPVDLNFFY
jgi:hypothetical protein